MPNRRMSVKKKRKKVSTLGALDTLEVELESDFGDRLNSEDTRINRKGG